jgi:hypothetical protein
VPGNTASFAVFFELGQWLRRQVWQPPRSMKDTFHPLPIVAAILIFLLLAYDGQIREIYLSYLEALNEPGASGIRSDFFTTVAAYLAALAGFALISAVLCEAHYALSTMRIGFIYSNLSNPEFGSRLRGVQRLTAVSLMLAPWLGLTVGLFHAKDYVSDLYPRLQVAGFDPGQIKAIQNLLPSVSASSIVITVLFAALVACFVIDHYRRDAMVQGAVIAFVPFATIGLFLLLIDLGPRRPGSAESVALALATVIAAIAYYLGYYRLCTRRSSFERFGSRAASFSRLASPRPGPSPLPSKQLAQSLPSWCDWPTQFPCNPVRDKLSSPGKAMPARSCRMRVTIVGVPRGGRTREAKQGGGLSLEMKAFSS